jgi:hypothetical protein
MAVWICGACERKVPERIGVCLCGAKRDFNAPPPAASRRREPVPAPSLPRRPGEVGFLGAMTVETWVYAVLIAVVLSAGLVTAALSTPPRMPALLGYTEPVH